MHCITGVITLAVIVGARLTFGEDTAPLRCYACVTDYEIGSQDPGCSISDSNVIIRTCLSGFDRCISYRARNSRTGKVVFRRHCATQEICNYQCLFSHHTNCQRTCCHGDLCNVVSFGKYIGTSSITKDPITTQNPNTTPKDDPTESSKSTYDPTVSQTTTSAPSNPTLTQTTTDAPVTTHNPSTTPKDDPTESSKSTYNPTVTQTTSALATTYKISTTEKSLVGGPPITSIAGCRDYREQCPEYAAYTGYCQYTKKFMVLYCPWSCQFCGNHGTTASPTLSDVTTKPSTESLAPSTLSVNTQGVTTDKPGNGGVAGPSTGCEDARVECSYFANFDGYCQYHYGFMLEHCPRSCALCDDVSLPESPVQKITTEKPTTNEQEIITNDQSQLKTTPFGPGGPDLIDYEYSGCIDLRENCTYYATTYDDYCNYNRDYMEIYCPFSCGFCGSTVSNGAFPHPPIIYEHQVSDQEFPPLPSKKDARWLTSYCTECYDDWQECFPKCILLLTDDNYELTSNDVCMKLLGKPKITFSC